MTEPFLGEIRRVSFNFAPKGWALCNGQLLAIQQNAALFSLLGTVYGGNGTTTFGLPDLRGRSAIHPSAEITQGMQGGEESHVLTLGEVPSHTHAAVAAADAGTVRSPAGAFWAVSDQPSYAYGASKTGAAAAVAAAGAGQPHENRSPFLVVNHVIALFGIYPSQN